MAKKASKSQSVKAEGQMTEQERAALMASSPTLRSAAVGSEYSVKLFGEVDQQKYYDLLADEVKAVRGGDLSRSKAMLAAQANTLDLLFNSLMRKAVNSEYLNQLETHMRLALKAQAQAAHTIKVLGELENPRSVAFVKQANIAAGHQQVNNGTPAPAHGKPGESANELLEVSNGNYLDTGTAGQASRGNTALEAVGAVYRPPE